MRRTSDLTYVEIDADDKGCLVENQITNQYGLVGLKVNTNETE